jgi:hypothetical protein
LANRFTVGQWICITGLGLQVFGYPPNFQYNEYKRVTNIVGSAITFDDPFTGSAGLTHTYLDTWPQIDSFPVTFTAANPTTVTWQNHGFSGSDPNQQCFFSAIEPGSALPGGIVQGQTYYPLRSGITENTFQLSWNMTQRPLRAATTGTLVRAHKAGSDLAGPATIFAMDRTFGGTHKLYGMTVSASDIGIVFGGNMSTVCCGCTFPYGTGPSASKSIVFKQCSLAVDGRQEEVDKCIESLTYDGCHSAQLFMQNSLGGSLRIANSEIAFLNGTALDTTIENSTISSMVVGCLGNGLTDRIRTINATIRSAAAPNVGLAAYSVSFSDGIFTVPNSSSHAQEVYRSMIPGHRYFLAFYDGSVHYVDDSGHVNMFTVVSITQDATTTYVTTDLRSALPPPYFLGRAFGPTAGFEYWAVPASEIIQQGSERVNITALPFTLRGQLVRP